MKKLVLGVMFSLPLALLSPMMAFASEANLKIPSLSQDQNHLLYYGFAVCILGILFGLYQFIKVRNMPAHQSMLDVSNTIYETCKTYLRQQAIAAAIHLHLVSASPSISAFCSKYPLVAC